MTSDGSMKLEAIEELSSRRRRGACGLDGEALEPSDVTGLRRRWPGATLREDIGVARLLSSLIVREAVPAVEESAPGFATSRSFSFLFLKKKRVLARLQPCNPATPCNPKFRAHGVPGRPADAPRPRQLRPVARDGNQSPARARSTHFAKGAI